MKNKQLVSLILVLSLSACSGTPAAKTEALPGKNSVQRVTLANPLDHAKPVEMFVAYPNDGEQSPAILYVQGFQDDVKLGAKSFVDADTLTHMADKGFVAAAVSLPGFGKSAGPADFSGALSQEAVMTALEQVRSRSDVNSDKVFLHGSGHGATVAAMLAARESRLAGVILVSGMYDAKMTYADLQSKGQSNPDIKATAARMLKETGGSEAAFAERSPVLVAEKIRVPVLLLHGENDEKLGISHVNDFAAKLQRNNEQVEFVAFRGEGHKINPVKRDQMVMSFVNKYIAGKR